MEKFAKYTLIIPIFLGLGAMFTVPWRWVIRNNATSLDPSGADRVRARTNSAARNTLSTHSLKRISRTKKSPFSHVEYPFYNLHPEKPIVDREGKVLEDFQHFQINCNGDTIAYNERFQCFEGPQITRYNPAGTQNAALLSQIQLTPDMAQKLPNLPEEFRERPIGNAFITIWGNLPNLQPEIGGGQHLMFRPETLVGQVPNSYGRLGKGLYPLNIGIFTDPDGGIVSVDRNQEAADLATGLALNDKLKQCRYDCHGENDVPHADPEQSVEDDVYLTSVMGTFDLDETSVHVFTSVAMLDSGAPQYKGFSGVDKTMISYQILLSDELTTQITPLFQKAENLRELLTDLSEFVSRLDPKDRGAQRLEKAVLNLIDVFS